MNKRLEKKKERLKLKIFQQKMINSAKLGINSFNFNGKTYLIACSGHLVQTLVNDRILYRISVKQKPKGENMGLQSLQYLI